MVERIKAFPNETKLLVVDQEADEYFKASNIVIKGTMANVKVIKTPEKNPNSVEQEELNGNNTSTDEVRISNRCSLTFLGSNQRYTIVPESIGHLANRN